MVSNEQIIREWQTTDDPAQVIAERLGMKLDTLRGRIGWLRKKGVVLKARRSQGGRKTADYAALAELARSLNGTHS